MAIRRRLNEDLYLNFAGMTTTTSGRDPGLRLPAGMLDLDRLLGADRRHAGLPGAEQSSKLQYARTAK